MFLLLNLLASAMLVSANPSCLEALSDVINGTLLVNGSLLADDGSVYPPEDFRPATNTTANAYLTCVCKHRPCITKCCPHQHVFRRGPEGRATCTFSPEHTAFYDRYAPRYHVLFEVHCVRKYRIEKDENFTVLDNGTLLLLFDGGASLSSVDDYCMEIFDVDNSTDLLPVHCFSEYTDSSDVHFIVISIGMMVSEPFLLATILVYVCIPQLRGQLVNRCLICQWSTLFTAFLFLIILQQATLHTNQEACVAIAFIVHFSFLASFFWLNIMCFDMWWTFSGMQRMRGSSKRVEHKKFIIYSAYAWGCPFAMLVVCLVMQFVADPVKYITPMFGHGKCWFGDDEAIFVYFYGPVAVLILANIIMFVTTALKILKLKRETAMLKHSDSRRHDEDGNNKERFSLYLKLFVVMGINWAMEVLSWAMGGPEYLWYFTDLGNTLQGVLIFFIFVWKKKIKRLLVRRFGKSSAANGHSKTSTRISTTRASTRATSLNSSTCFTDTANTYPLVHTNSVVA